MQRSHLPLRSWPHRAARISGLQARAAPAAQARRAVPGSVAHPGRRSHAHCRRGRYRPRAAIRLAPISARMPGPDAMAGASTTTTSPRRRAAHLADVDPRTCWALEPGEPRPSAATRSSCSAGTAAATAKYPALRTRLRPATTATSSDNTSDPGRPGASHRPPSDPPQSEPNTGPPACLTALETNFLKSKSSRTSPGTVRKPCRERRRPINIDRKRHIEDISAGAIGRKPSKADKTLDEIGRGPGGLHALRRLFGRAWMVAQGDGHDDITASDIDAAVEQGVAADDAAPARAAE